MKNWLQAEAVLHRDKFEFVFQSEETYEAYRQMTSLSTAELDTLVFRLSQVDLGWEPPFYTDKISPIPSILGW